MKQNHKNTFVAIMAGGVGSRFWPSSRESLPKQFLDILGVGKSLIQLTCERFEKMVDPSNILVLTNKMYVDLVKEHLPQLPHANIIAEPSRNNTAPCNALLALKIHALNEDACLVIAPSDHVILKEDSFISNISKAVSFANENSALLTLGIEPSRPDTGYGYIEMGPEAGDKVFKVNSFREKPDLDTAKKYLSEGSFVWNAGIFIWKASEILSAFKEKSGQIIDVLSEDLSQLNSDAEQAYIDKVYPNTEKISIDYAILERAENVYTIPSDIGWSDLGTWNSLHAYLDKDETQNVTLCKNPSVQNVSNCMIKSYDDKLVVVDGLEDYIIIDEKDVLLIYPKSKEQEIKQVRKSIEDQRFL